MTNPTLFAPNGVIAEVDLLLQVLPEEIRTALYAIDHQLDDLVEIVLDLGRQPEARFSEKFYYFGEVVTKNEIEHVLALLSPFGEDNRAGIERTLHRISAMRNRQGAVIGLTLRVGRARFGTIEMIRDIISTGESIMLMGRPGVGKTTLLREAARFVADELHKRVIVVDTSNEIAGDGDIPHPAIGHARRMQVAHVQEQHKVMIEAVENHMPEVVVVDEIGTAEEALAARTIAERGVQLIATAHGISLKNLVQNPTLTDLVGGIQAVTLGDDEARRRGSQKTVLERKTPPTFSVLVELQDRETMAVHRDVAAAVDSLLRQAEPQPEIRVRDGDSWKVMQEGDSGGESINRTLPHKLEASPYYLPSGNQVLKVFSFGVHRSLIEKAIYRRTLPVITTRDIDEADAVLTTKASDSRRSERLSRAYDKGTPVFIVRANISSQVESALVTMVRQRPEFRETSRNADYINPLEEAELAIEQAIIQMKPVELKPQDAYTRRLQHELIEQSGLRSRSSGMEPRRRVVVYP